MKVSLLVLSVLVSCVCVSARLQATPIEFETQGLDLLGGVYGQQYPGYGGQNLLQGQGQFGQVGFGQQQFGLGQQQFGLGQQQFGQVGLGGGFGGQVDPLAAYGGGQFAQQFGGQQQFGALGGLGGFGAGLGAGGAKKGQTVVAKPIYAQPLIVPKIITQPILRPHMVTQPILQQQLITQPIVETRHVIQPYIRRIITQPIIKPEILETTTVQPTIKQQTIVQPHLIEQTVITPTMQNTMEENAPITTKAQTRYQQPVVQPAISAKKGQQAYGGY